MGLKNCDENILQDENLIDCHRKELIGNESAKDILLAINLNVNNLLNELRKKNYLIGSTSIGISFDIPLEIIENIFDFWLDAYKDQEAWEACLGLLKIRKRIPLTNLIETGSLKGNSRKLAIKIETLHTYVPSSLKNEKLNDPMWE